MVTRIVPSFSLGFGILNISMRTVWTRLYDEEMAKNNEKFSSFKIHYVGAGTDMLFLLVTSIIFTLAIFLIEIISNRFNLNLKEKNVKKKEIE